MEITLIREPGPSVIGNDSIIDLTGGSNVYYSLNIAYTKTNEDNRSQIQYCISQMKRFALCMKADEKTLRVHQFFYTLGRIQELLGSTPHIWWNPFENMIKEKNMMISSHTQIFYVMPLDASMISQLHQKQIRILTLSPTYKNNYFINNYHF